ncbi:D-glycero-beta-D-manno-heptose 1-phosphate adenylyltransferase [Ralstonia pickettii]|nr:D-glycero-beta-D-manno-heptose 1-phosphate adenylyltransferase [Ralstonia pickettii]
MIDHYLWGNCERISPEAPVQVVDVHKETTVLGGAGNVVNNLVALGAHVTVIGAVGNDETGRQLTSMLQAPQIVACMVTEDGRKTSRKTRVIAAHQQVVRYDSETRNPIQEETERKILAEFEESLIDSDIVLLSDYGKGLLTPALTQQLIRSANAQGKKVLVDPKGSDYSKYANAYLLTPNKKEATQATGISINSRESLQRAITELKNRLNLAVSIITLSEEGIAVWDNTLTVKQAAARDVFDVTGAGDTVLAALGYKLAQDHPLHASVEFANLAAGVVVGKIGSATATLDEIAEYEASLQRHVLGTRIKSRIEISSIAAALRKQQKKIVFTNGCFDILHRGHISYLKDARKLGDVLIVGLNSDASVKRLKGENRPVNSEEDRAVVLSALEYVDYVVIFDEDTPYELIREIGADILVKGGDYEGKNVVGSDLVKEVRLIKFLEGKSTTSIINSIRAKEAMA